MKWSVTLTDRLGPEMLTVLEIKGQVLHCVRLLETVVIQPLSTRLIKPNFCFDLSHRRSTTVSLETRNPFTMRTSITLQGKTPRLSFISVQYE